MVEVKEKLVSDVGINDADYCVQKFKPYTDIDGKKKSKLIWVCPFYRRWKLMVDRCYYRLGKESRLNPTYKDCTVCDEWLRFSNFRSWMEQQDWEGKHLDKDLLSGSSKIYSAQTCCFIPMIVNMFMTERDSNRGKYLIGVDFMKNISKFRARCKNPFTGKSVNLGYFESEEEAHQAWLNKKISFAKMLALDIEDISIAQALVYKYENYRVNLEVATA